MTLQSHQTIEPHVLAGQILEHLGEDFGQLALRISAGGSVCVLLSVSPTGLDRQQIEDPIDRLWRYALRLMPARGRELKAPSGGSTQEKATT